MDKIISFLFAAAGTLVLALALLLFLQWPLREALDAYSREANDLAQIIFAWYVAVGITAASALRLHLTAKRSGTQGARAARWRCLATALCVCPWAVFMLWSCLPTVWQSVGVQEHFAETLNPGYFAIRLALLVMLVLMILGLLGQLRRKHGADAPGVQ